MRAFRLPLFACALILSVAACGGTDPVEEEADNVAGLPAVNEPAPSATGEPRGNAVAPVPALPAPAATIPAALHGRWGLTPADCTSTRGDAKGLLVIGAGELRFYESRAVPAAEISTTPNSISGEFAFTGEGQSWSKHQSLQLQQQGLVRTESNPTASFTYAKCD